MGDEDHALSFFDKVAHDLHQLIDLLRSEHRRRLVKNKNLRIPIEHFQDLHPLLHPDGDVLDDHVRIDIQAIPGGKVGDPTGCGFSVEDKPALFPEDDVFSDGEVVNQLEVLVHHADSQVVCIVGVPDLNLLSANLDRPFIGLVEPEKDAHQR